MARIDIFAEQDNNMVSGLEGQKIIFFGNSDCGKTFQATRFPKPLLLMTESGGNARNVPKFPIDDWDDFTQIVNQLVSSYEKAREKYQTIIIDTLEMLVSICENKVAKRYGVLDISMVQDASDDPKKPNPNGYSLSRTMFKNQVNRLTRHGYTVIFISHETEKKDGQLIPYGSDKEKGSTRFVRDLCDFVIHTQAQGVDPETQKTIYSKATCKETKEVFARSRYPMMQTYIDEFTAENVIEAIEKAIKLTAEEENAGLVSFKVQDMGYTKDDYIDMLQPYVVKLFEIKPDYVAKQVEEHLGAGMKVSQATNDQVNELGNLYSSLVDYCTQMGIKV